MDVTNSLNICETANSNTGQHMLVPNSAVHSLKCFAPCHALDASAGDLIEIDRTLYSHWAVYVGDSRVIHVCSQNSANSPGIATHAEIVEDELQNVAGASLVRVNNKEVPAMQRNLTALQPKLVVENSKKALQQKVTQNVMSVTAEQFATSCRYGVAWSDQANTIASVLKKRNRPGRLRNRSGNQLVKKEHTMTLRRKDSLHKPISITEATKDPRRIGDPKDARKCGDPAALAPLVKGLAEIFKHKIPTSKMT